MTNQLPQPQAANATATGASLPVNPKRKLGNAKIVPVAASNAAQTQTMAASENANPAVGGLMGVQPDRTTMPVARPTLPPNDDTPPIAEPRPVPGPTPAPNPTPTPAPDPVVDNPVKQNPDQPAAPVTLDPVNTPDFSNTPTLAEGGGLLGSNVLNFSPTSNSAGSTPTFGNTITDTTGAAQQSVNMPGRYQAQDGVVSEDMRVEDRIAGLMSQDSVAMQKAIEQANRLSGARGLQSSSIATENALNSMFNFALPIAQQDASTYTNQSFLNQEKQQQVGMQDNAALNQLNLQRDQQNFTASENSADRRFQSQLENQKAQNTYGVNSALQEDQQNFQSGENAADRNFQSQLEQQRSQNQLDINSQLQDDQQQFAMELEKYKTSSQFEINKFMQDDMQNFNKELETMRYNNSLGLLDAESKDRLDQLEVQHQNALTQMDKSAEIQTARDNLLQNFQQSNITLQAAKALEQLEAQAKEQMKLQLTQNDFARSMEYSNAVSNAVNFGIEALGNAFMNPELDPSEYDNIQTQINTMVQNQIDTYADIYGIGSGGGSDFGGGGDDGDIGVPPPQETPPGGGGAPNPNPVPPNRPQSNSGGLLDMVREDMR